MKKYLWCLPAFICLLAACTENPPSSISNYDDTKLNITAYAEDTDVAGGFSFTAAEAWTTQIDYNSLVRSAEDNWITIDPASGDAGTVTIAISLQKNNTRKDRSAIIKIYCGETTLSINVKQKSTSNPNPENPSDTTIVSPVASGLLISEMTYIWKNESTNNSSQTNVRFEYDLQNTAFDGMPLLTKVQLNSDDPENIDFGEARFFYGSDEITLMFYDRQNNVVEECIAKYNGNRITSSTVYYADGRIDAEYAFTYDNNGYLIHTKEISHDDYDVPAQPGTSVAPIASRRKSGASAWLKKAVNDTTSHDECNYNLSWNNEGNLYRLDWNYGTEEVSFSNLPNPFGSERVSQKLYALDLNQLLLGFGEGLYFAFGSYGFFLSPWMGHPCSNLISKISSTMDYGIGEEQYDYKTDDSGRITEITTTDQQDQETGRYIITYREF